MYIIAVLTILLFAGCANSKPATPTEVQMITQVFAKRIVVGNLSLAQRARIVAGIESAKTALETMAPLDLLSSLNEFLGPENKDIAELIAVLVRERVDLAALPEIEGKAYLWAVLDGIEGGLQ